MFSKAAAGEPSVKGKGKGRETCYKLYSVITLHHNVLVVDFILLPCNFCCAAISTQRNNNYKPLEWIWTRPNTYDIFCDDKNNWPIKHELTTVRTLCMSGIQPPWPSCRDMTWTKLSEISTRSPLRNGRCCTHRHNTRTALPADLSCSSINNPANNYNNMLHYYNVDIPKQLAIQLFKLIPMVQMLALMITIKTTYMVVKFVAFHTRWKWQIGIDDIDIVTLWTCYGAL